MASMGKDVKAWQVNCHQRWVEPLLQLLASIQQNAEGACAILSSHIEILEVDASKARKDKGKVYEERSTKLKRYKKLRDVVGPVRFF